MNIWVPFLPSVWCCDHPQNGILRRPEMTELLRWEVLWQRTVMFRPVLSSSLQMRHTGRLWFHHSRCLLSFWLRQLLEPAPPVSLRELWASNQSSHIWTPSYNQENPESAHYTNHISRKMEKWGALCRRWAGIHPVLHKFQFLPCEVQSLTCSLGELGLFPLLLPSAATLLLTLYKDVSSCLEIGQMQCEERSLKVKICPLIFLR